MFTLDPAKLDAAIARVAPTIELTLDDRTHSIPVISMDCFHPDSLLKLDHLFAAAQPVAEEPQQQVAATKEQETDENDFSRLLGGSAAGADALAVVAAASSSASIAPS